MADVNAWSIIVPGVVTPTVVALFAFSQQRAQRQQAATDELRLVVDAAAEALSTATQALLDLTILWQRGRRLTIRETGPTTQALRELRFATDRLVIRVGASARVAETHQRATSAAWDYWRLVTQAMAAREEFDRDGFNRVNDALKDRRLEFLEAARALVGYHLARLPSPLYPALPLPPGRTS
jgi:hypothetical protein